ncbi:MAG: hypothetical protein HUU02_14665 [Bacteroidetes bacterium]|nr:hypothetical protein [Bacteroidota bacterium]
MGHRSPDSFAHPELPEPGISTTNRSPSIHTARSKDREVHFLGTISRLLLCFIFIMSPGCTDTGADESKTVPFYPLAVGNVWQYRLIKYDSVGNNPVPDTSTYIERIVGDTMINALQWSVLEYSSGRWMFAYPCRSTDSGMIVNITTPRMYLKYPPTLYERYKGFGDLQVISIHEPTPTLAGTFTCVVYRQFLADDPEGVMYADLYVAPGIGKVKIEGILSPDDTTFIRLIEYSLFQYTLK